MSEVTFTTPHGPLRGYCATPPTAGPWPGVVVLHEAFGLNDDVRKQADRLAANGYLALAPDLYSWGPTFRCLRATFGALRRREGRAFDDIDAAHDWLAARDDCTGRVGVIGFCLGGGFALLTAPRGRFAVSAANYGDVPQDAEAVLAGSCPVVGSYGAKDRMMRGHADRLEKALTALGVEHDVKEYAAASHSFLYQQTGWTGVLAKVAGIGLHEPSAQDAWARILGFLARHLQDG